MQEEGYIAKLLYPEGAKDVKLGQIVAIVVESKDDVAKFKDYAGDSGSSPTAAATPSPAAPASPKKADAPAKSASAAPQ
jgi:pyruvate dehydrogenase E2 component (dihydrolipoamide acetyltransferase)